MNTPTVYNSRYNFVQSWDGRIKTLEEQIDESINNQDVLNTNWNSIIEKLNKNSYYKKVFKQIYGKNINKMDTKNAIVEFIKSLVTPSRFDKYLLGDKSAITTLEQKGYRLFKEYGCSSCHQGKNVGGNLFGKLGTFEKYYKKETLENLGRYNILKTNNSKHLFKVPTLRNIAITFPYLHDGSIESIREVISIMGIYQLGRQITDGDIDKIVAFLNSLTGEQLEKSQE